jgi:Ca-activated chloride channel family protein
VNRSCRKGLHAYEVELGSGNAVPLDRDIVVRWQIDGTKVGVSAETVAPFDALSEAHALLTIVPPAKGSMPAPVSRDVILLLDTSGSMGDDPLRQAQRIASALVDGLSDADQLEMVEFSNAPRRYKSGAVRATKDERREALRWIGALRASGGTEMREGIREAMRTLRIDSQRQIVLVTDGLIGFESEVVAEILSSLPEGSRLHTVGVGSSVNRSLTAPAARAGRGVEIVVGLGEDPERAARKLKARTEAPLVVGVTAEGSALVRTAPARLPDLFAGSPVLLSACVRPEGGSIVLRGRTAEGAWEERIELAPDGRGRRAVARLYGREAVEDAEMRLGAGEPRAAIDRETEALGLLYGIATRLTSWVAVDAEVSVDPTKPARRERVPHALPHGLSVEGLGLRAPGGVLAEAAAWGGAGRARLAGPGSPPPMAGAPMPPPMSPMRPPMMSAPKPAPEEQTRGGFVRRVAGLFKSKAAESFDDDAPDAAADRLEVPPAPRQAAIEMPKKERAERAELEADEFSDTPAILLGTVVLFKDGKLIVEIVAPLAIHWDPISVAVADGTTATLDASVSTGKGTVEPGTTIRVVLSLPRDTARPASLVVTMPSGDYRVVLR